MRDLRRTNIVRALLISILLFSSVSAFAQENKLYLGEIVGEPCRSTSFSNENANRSPTPRTQYLKKVTKVTAVTVAGAGSTVDNDLVIACMRTAQRRTDAARSSTHLRLYLDLYSEAFRACVSSQQRRVPVYEVSFRHEDRCGVPTQ